MKIRLGYVAISLTLSDTSYCHTMTYSKYQKMPHQEAHQRLHQILKENMKNFKTILKYNHQNKIEFFRFSPTIVPLATHPNVTFDYITPYQKEWLKIGKIITKYHIRIDTHPDQYCILNSNDNQIVNNSINTLKYHCQLFKAMNISSQIILHIGGKYDNKKESIERFIHNFQTLPKELKKIIILENDDKIYNIKDTLYVCQTLNIPMVLDYHHYKCNNEKEKIEDYLPQILATWNNTDLPPKIHFSSPKSKTNPKAHSDYINYKDFIKFINIIAIYQQDIDIMLECKAKDEALFRLIRQLKIYTNFNIHKNSIIIKKDKSQD